MRIRNFLSIVILCSALVAGCATRPSSPPLDFGDSSVNNLWYQVEYRRNEGDPDQALIYADKLIELYSAEALEQQTSLSDYPVGQAVYSYNTLNYVGLTLLMKGDMLKEKGDNAGAREAYNSLVRDFAYAQPGIEDNFVKVSVVAKERLGELNDDSS